MNANGKLPLRDISLPWERPMSLQRSKVCGIDVHKTFFVAAVLSNTGEFWIDRFSHDRPGLLALKDWILDHGCEVVAVESTGVYWYSIYSTLEESVPVIVANPYLIKNIPGRKTDVIDAQWIAELTLNNLIKPSRIFPKDDRELRNLTRAREKLVQNRTRLKNRIHRSLESASIKLSSVLSDIFGKSGQYILEHLLQGTPIDEIIQGIPSQKIRDKEEALKNAIQYHLSDDQILIIEQSLEQIGMINRQIQELDDAIQERLGDRDKDLQIAMSMPGIGWTSGVTILAEIGDYRDFESPDKLAAWAGLVPTVYQSADKMRTGRITKQGSKHLRWILVEAAQAAAKKRGSVLRRFFLRIKNRKGYNIAVVALARKILCILWHILVNKEYYTEENIPTKKVRIPRRIGIARKSVEKSIELLVEAGYLVWKQNIIDPGGG